MNFLQQHNSDAVARMAQSQPSLTAMERALTRDEVYAIADFRSVDFATLIQQQLRYDSNRFGIARRLLLTIGRKLAGRDINFRFNKPHDNKVQMMRDQMLDAWENSYVKEDRELFSLVRANIPAANVLTIKAEEFSAQKVAQARALVTAREVPAVVAMAFGGSMWNDIIGNEDFSQMVDPESKMEGVLSGLVGVMYGTNMFSDSFRDPQHRVFDSTEMFFFGPRDEIGCVAVSLNEPGRVELRDVAERGRSRLEWTLETDFIGFEDIDYSKISMLRIIK